MNIDKNTILPNLIYSLPVKYDDNITLSPVRMKNYLNFQTFSKAITVRKNSRFPDKDIIKMNYLEFIVFASKNPETGIQYGVPDLFLYFNYVLALLSMVCVDHEIKYNKNSGEILINGELLTSEKFDDLRKIIILQNGIDFDIDEFLNMETEDALERAKEIESRNKDKAGLEDYVDALCVALNMSEEKIAEMTIRKFWRLVKRVELHEDYVILKTGEVGGLVKFKEPIKHWMISIDESDPYASLKTDEEKIKGKIADVNL